MQTREETVPGFTLVETMVAGTILLSMSLVAMLWLNGASDLWWMTTTQSDIRTNTQHALNRVVSELRSATRTAAASPPNAAIPARPGNTTMTFYLPADLDPLDGNTTIVDAIGNIEWNLNNPIRYTYLPATRQLVRTEGAQQSILSNDVSSVAFEDSAIDPALMANEIRVALTLQKRTPQRRSVQATVTEIVKLRN